MSLNEIHSNQKLFTGIGLGQFVCKRVLYLNIFAQNLEKLISKNFCKTGKQ